MKRSRVVGVLAALIAASSAPARGAEVPVREVTFVLSGDAEALSNARDGLIRWATRHQINGYPIGIDPALSGDPAFSVVAHGDCASVLTEVRRMLKASTMASPQSRTWLRDYDRTGKCATYRAELAP